MGSLRRIFGADLNYRGGDCNENALIWRKQQFTHSHDASFIVFV